MSTVQQLRLEARWSVAQLARAANIDRKTVERAEEGKGIQDVKAYAITSALSEKLGRDIELSSVDDLKIL